MTITSKFAVSFVACAVITFAAWGVSHHHASAQEAVEKEAAPKADVKKEAPKKEEPKKEPAAKDDAAKKSDAAPAEGATTSIESGWISRCQDLKDGETVTGKYCEGVQTLMVVKKGEDPSKGQRVTEMAIGYPPNIGDDAQGVIVLPLGIVVDEDIVIEVDAKKVLSFPVRYCDSGGCAALFKLDKSDIEKFRKGTEIMVKTKAFTGQPVTIALSLKNFVTVMDEIKPKK